MSKTISVIIPAYNVEGYIAQCLDSLLGQSIKPNEIIVINDGSTDSTETVARLYQRKSEIIKVFSFDNGGLCAARNKGLCRASSDYVMFLDSDDKMATGAIEKCLKIIEKHEPDVIVGRIEFFTEKKKWTGKSYDDVCSVDRLTTFNETPALINCMNVGPKCFNKQFLWKNNFHFIEGVMMTEDHWFSMNVLSKAKKIFLTNSIIFNYRRDREGSSTVTNKLSYYNDMLKVQQALQDINFSNKEEYFERLIKFDLRKYGSQAIFSLKNNYERIAAATTLQEIFRLLPENSLKHLNADQLQIFESPKWFIYKKIITATFKRVAFSLISPLLIPLKKICEHLYKVSNEFYLKTRKNRRQYLKIIYRILTLLPIKREYVLFTIRPSSKMSNMQILYDALSKEGYNTKKLEAKITTLADDFRCMYNIAKSKVILTDGDYYFLFGLKKSNSLKVIQLWHAGGAFKKFGCDIYAKNDDRRSQQEEHHTSYTYVIASSKSVVPFYSSAFNISQDNILPLGVPRTDALFKININQAREFFYKKYNLDPKKKIIVYAPTFREPNGAFKDLGKFECKINIDKFNEKFGEKYYLALRIHPNYKIDSKEFSKFINVSTEKQDLVLAVADCLISDYSSIIFDYAYFRRPMFFYAYDLINYLKERSFYENYATIVPGPIVTNEEELFAEIEQHIQYFNPKDIESFWDKYMGSCEGHSTQNLIELVRKIYN